MKHEVCWSEGFMERSYLASSPYVCMRKSLMLYKYRAGSVRGAKDISHHWPCFPWWEGSGCCSAALQSRRVSVTNGSLLISSQSVSWFLSLPESKLTDIYYIDNRITLVCTGKLLHRSVNLIIIIILLIINGKFIFKSSKIYSLFWNVCVNTVPKT